MVIGAVLCAEFGVVMGLIAADQTQLFAMLKGLGIFIIGPVVFYIFPEWPQWIAMLFPTYWVIDPIWSSAVLGNGLGEVWVDLLIALAVVPLLMPSSRVISSWRIPSLKYSVTMNRNVPLPRPRAASSLSI